MRKHFETLRKIQSTMVAASFLLAISSILFAPSLAYVKYKNEIPNGNQVPNPCPEGGIWGGVGHQGKLGGNARNPFGVDFKAAGFKWTVSLCLKDSDGDGMTNGFELGDPACVWTPGALPSRTTNITHPGLCPLDSKTCVNAWEVCPKAFSCPAMTDPGVFVRNFTFPTNTPVPAKETTYICQAFELSNTTDAVHMIGSRPVIVNKIVMHHILMYGCSARPRQALFDGPQECFMGMTNCNEIINIWGYGLEGECFNSNAGLKIGGNGYRYGIMQLHWNNPTLQTTHTDSSGLSLYFTPNLRTYDLGVSMYGEMNLIIPPRQPIVSVNHTCPSVCSKATLNTTRYITSTTIHMHNYGIQGRVSLWRDGSLVKDLSPLQVYDYNSPVVYNFDPPIKYEGGDEIKTECYYNSLRSNRSVFFGESTSDEMCLSFLTYYPNNLSAAAPTKLSECLAISGINLCWLQAGNVSQVEQGCNITAMKNGEIPTRVNADMTAKKCFSRTGCDPECRDYLNYTLWPTNSCYDPKRARQMAELLATGFLSNPAAQSISISLYGQRLCEQEINNLAFFDKMASMPVPTMPSMTTGPAAPMRSNGDLTSEHKLIIIIVCSCLGVVLLLAVLAVIASKVGSSSAGSSSNRNLGDGDRGKAYMAGYDNQVTVNAEATKL